MIDRNEFAKVLSVLAAAFNEQVNEQRADAYYQMLGDFELSAIQKAAAKIMYSSKYFPKIADFVEAIDGSTEDKASNAWYKFEKALDHPGPYKTLDLGDPFAHATIRDMDLWGMGIERNGYPDGRKDYDFVRQEFIRRYRVHAKQSDPLRLPQSLPGIFEEENRKKIAAGEHLNWTPGQLAFVEQQSPGILPTTKAVKKLE